MVIFRSVLTYQHVERFHETPEFWLLFVVGLRMDLILLCYFIIAPTILLLLTPKRFEGLVQKVVAAWCAISLALIVYMEIATFPFLEEYDLRPDQKFLEYLQHVQEVATTLIKVYALEVLIGTVALIVCAVFVWRTARSLMANAVPWSWRRRFALFPIVAALLFLGARSTVGHRPANISTACFSENHLANELALNSTYSMLYAAYRMLRHEKNPSLDYGKMDHAEVFARVQASAIEAGTPVQSDVPLAIHQDSPFNRSRPQNIVIFLQESMGAVDVGCLKGPPITPNLCRLKDEGLWLSNLYATGTRTVRGIEAVVSGFLPTSAVGVVKLGKARKHFFTAASLLKKHGYATDFIYGGMSNFDEMKSFFLGNGFDTIHDQPTFKDPAFLGTWGVSDEDLVRKANDVFVAHGDKPFFAVMLSTSNHLPYEFPDGRITLYEEPKQTHFNAIKYADYAIGLFFELAKKEAYYKDTIFLVVADHNSHVRGNEHVPVSKFHIPGFIIGPDVPAMELKLLASQIDLLPTLLHYSGLDTTHPMIGRNLMQLPPETVGRSFMQFASNNAYRVGNEVLIHRPFMAPLQFTYRDESQELIPSKLDPEMAKDALAYAHLPWLLYAGEDYRVPN